MVMVEVRLIDAWKRGWISEEVYLSHLKTMKPHDGITVDRPTGAVSGVDANAKRLKNPTILSPSAQGTRIE